MIINGKKLAEQKLTEIKKIISAQKLTLQLDIINIGDNPASKIFIQKKTEAAEKIGVKIVLHNFDSNVDPVAIEATCNKLNNDPNCNAYFIQLPLPKEKKKLDLLNAISPAKDVDCLTSTSLGAFFKDPVNNFGPATVEAVKLILKKYPAITLKSSKIALINDSNLIGKPLCAYLLSQGATVTVCNEFTRDLEKITKESDIIITATGVSHLLTEKFIKEGTIIIDCGISKKSGKITGDVDFDAVKSKAKLITPVPGGIGPMTVAALFDNLLKIYNAQNK